ncbi:MAG: DUF1353 domain-containing protein, partial [Bacteroidetes bacterium]|nr:DUF1353 domain-containing protein [Bacteroidota bacterium]
PDDVRWTAPAGDIIDGASIPRGLWTIVGAPFDGLYRKASVIHDVGCVRRTRSMDDTHRAFYYACRLGGVSEAKALLMYWAVSQFAEPWPDPGSTTVDSTLVTQASLAPSDSAFAVAAEYFESYADSLSGTDPDHRRQLLNCVNCGPPNWSAGSSAMSAAIDTPFRSGSMPRISAWNVFRTDSPSHGAYSTPIGVRWISIGISLISTLARSSSAGLMARCRLHPTRKRLSNYVLLGSRLQEQPPSLSIDYARNRFHTRTAAGRIHLKCPGCSDIRRERIHGDRMADDRPVAIREPLAACSIVVALRRGEQHHA